MGGGVGPTRQGCGAGGPTNHLIYFSFFDLFLKSVVLSAMPQKIKNTTNLTADKLRQLLHYDPETGVFTRLTKWGSRNIGDVPGCLTPQGYWYIGVNSNVYPAHRLAWLYVNGCWPNGDIDHIDRNRCNNRISNLRDVTRSTNLHNSPAQNPKSGHKGVYRTKEGNWQVQIKVEYEIHRLGTYENLDDAVAARKFAEQILIRA